MIQPFPFRYCNGGCFRPKIGKQCFCVEKVVKRNPCERGCTHIRCAYQEAKAKRKRDANKLKSRNYRQANPGRMLAHHKKRRLGKIRRTPAWADLEAIAAIYIQARARGMVVDHIVPLQGETVCGLHVHNNLRIVTFAVNATKNNRLIEALL